MPTIVKCWLIGAMLAVLAAAGAEKEFKVIFDGNSGTGWILCDKKPLPKDHVQSDGLNPHGTGSYLVVHETQYGDFALDFDYKLTKGCNSGVFIRTSNLNDPVNTGIEVAIDDTTGTGMHDSGALYDLVATKENAQKPAGEWNHMTITAKGPKMTVTLNDKEVSTINLDEWNEPGKRPDGSSHKFANVAIGKLPRAGYVGFQDHGSDCWFKNVKIKELD
jgi:Domain of Unknown Function (DUF1080)